jgi:hypothetical protein
MPPSPIETTTLPLHHQNFKNPNSPYTKFIDANLLPYLSASSLQIQTPMFINFQQIKSSYKSTHVTRKSKKPYIKYALSKKKKNRKEN